MTEPKRWTACDQLREAVAALPQYVITIQDREGYTYERGCAGQPMNYTGVMLADVEALVGRELKYDAPVARETTDELKDAHRPWPIAPDTVMPPRRQPIRWGSRADDPPTEIHDDPQRTKAYLAGLAAGRTEAAAASPDERLREALRDANEYLAQIADYSPSEVADAIDSVRAQIKDALAATDSRGKPDGASVPDQSCATCGGSGDRNGNRRAADPFGTCPGCGGTGNVAAADQNNLWTENDDLGNIRRVRTRRRSDERTP